MEGHTSIHSVIGGMYGLFEKKNCNRLGKETKKWRQKRRDCGRERRMKGNKVENENDMKMKCSTVFVTIAWR